MRKMTLAVVVLVLAAPLASFAAAPTAATAAAPAALSCAGSGLILAFAETDAAAAPLFGAPAASRLQAPLLAASAASVIPLLKLPPHCSLSCTPCQPGGSCCVLCGTCGFDPRCN